ncbi:MAG: anti-sigma factor [Ahrensia sp.]|nr:anti-sigma factor [Ahrensia sp.]
MSTQEQQLDAGEYVIGTLSADERRAFEEALAADPNLQIDLQVWERQLGLLGTTISPEPVPDHVWSGIEQAIGMPSSFKPADIGSVGADGAGVAALQRKIANNDNMIADLRISVQRWRRGAVAAALAAFALGAIVFSGSDVTALPDQSVAESVEGKTYVAVVNANGDLPSLLVNIDTASGDITLRSLGIERPAGRSLELWYVPPGQAPVSVGLVSEGTLDFSQVDLSDNGLLAVSLEPQGGSPTGSATGPVLYTGKLVDASAAEPQVNAEEQ